MNIALCSALWHRHTLAPLWWRGITRLQRRFARHGHTLSVTVSGSEPKHRTRALRHGATWVECENTPLGQKWNAAVEAACLAGADYVLILGADDFLSNPIIEWYAERLRERWLYVGLAGIYFYEPSTERLAIYQPATAEYGAPIGAGRLVHRVLLEDQGYRPWADWLNRRLDASMARRAKLPAARLFHVTREAPALDVKTRANLWTYDTLATGYAAPHIVAQRGPLRLPEWGAITGLREPAWHG